MAQLNVFLSLAKFEKAEKKLVLGVQVVRAGIKNLS
jgi:hypothetical protein